MPALALAFGARARLRPRLRFTECESSSLAVSIQFSFLTSSLPSFLHLRPGRWPPRQDQDESRSWRILILILITTFPTTRQAGGCKYHTCWLFYGVYPYVWPVIFQSRISDVFRHAERRLLFNVDGLRRLAAQSIDRSPADIVDLAKLAEGGFNFTFVTMRDGFQMVAHIPYPVPVPKYYAVTSEVVTMDLLRSSDSLFPRFTDTRLNRTTRLEPSISSWSLSDAPS